MVLNFAGFLDMGSWIVLQGEWFALPDFLVSLAPFKRPNSPVNISVLIHQDKVADHENRVIRLLAVFMLLSLVPQQKTFGTLYLENVRDRGYLLTSSQKPVNLELRACLVGTWYLGNLFVRGLYPPVPPNHRAMSLLS